MIRANSLGSPTLQTRTELCTAAKLMVNVRVGSNSDKLAASITRPHHPDNRKSFTLSDKCAIFLGRSLVD